MAIKIDDVISRILSDQKSRLAQQTGQSQTVRGAGASGSGKSQGSSPASGDTLSLSGPVRELLSSGLDLERSRVQQQESAVSFNLAFTSQSTQIQEIRSDGTYNLTSRSMQLDFSFQSAFTVTDAATGEQRQEMYQFSLHLEASQVEASYDNTRTEKEDIGKFAMDILKDVAKLQSEGKDVDGIELKPDDLKELGGMDGGKLLKRIVHTLGLMRAVHSMDDKEREHVRMRPERGETQVETRESMESQSMQLSLSVQRLKVRQQETPVAADATATDTTLPSSSS
ncbi:MAG: hypothetical protein ACLGPL_12120 [Acidobacteriota bacterium]